MNIANELAKHFNVKFVTNSSSPDFWDYRALHMVRDGKSDLALCSSWLSINHYLVYGMSDYIHAECGTLLVPTPTLVSSALYAFFPFSLGVWVAILCSLIGTACLLTGVSRWHLSQIRTHYDGSHNRYSKHGRVYTDVVRSFLDLVNIATCHGTDHLPNYATAKITLMRLLNFFTDITQHRIDSYLYFSWTLLTFLLAVGYSTGYTSILSSPIYRKSVDSLNEFIQDGKLHY